MQFQDRLVMCKKIKSNFVNLWPDRVSKTLESSLLILLRHYSNIGRKIKWSFTSLTVRKMELILHCVCIKVVAWKTEIQRTALEVCARVYIQSPFQRNYIYIYLQIKFIVLDWLIICFNFQKLSKKKKKKTKESTSRVFILICCYTVYLGGRKGIIVLRLSTFFYNSCFHIKLVPNLKSSLYHSIFVSNSQVYFHTTWRRTKLENKPC